MAAIHPQQLHPRIHPSNLPRELRHLQIRQPAVQQNRLRMRLPQNEPSPPRRRTPHAPAIRKPVSTARSLCLNPASALASTTDRGIIDPAVSLVLAPATLPSKCPFSRLHPPHQIAHRIHRHDSAGYTPRSPSRHRRIGCSPGCPSSRPSSSLHLQYRQRAGKDRAAPPPSPISRPPSPRLTSSLTPPTSAESSEYSASAAYSASGTIFTPLIW